MAKNVGLIGGLTGKLGNTVNSVRRGVQISRVYQPVVANPKTKRQQLSRAKLALATATIKPLRLFVRAGWQLHVPTYEFQKAVGMMIPVAGGVIDGPTIDALTVDFGGLAGVLSANDMGSISSNTPTAENEGEVEVTITIPASMALDEGGNPIEVGAVMAVYCPDMDDAVIMYQAAADGEVEATIQVPTAWSGLQCHVYAFAKQIPTASNGISTTSQPWMYPAPTSMCMYCGTVTIA